MWINQKRLKAMLTDSMYEAITSKGNIYQGQIEKLKEEVTDLKLQKKIEMQEIEHLVKLEKEKMAVEQQKSKLAQAEEFAKKEVVLRQEFFDKNMSLLKEEAANLREVYSKIMSCLPNVNLELNKELK